MIISRKSPCAICLKLNQPLSHGNHFYWKEQLTYKLWLVSRVFGRYFLKNEWSEPVNSRKTTVCVSNDKIRVFRQKWGFWKTCIHNCELIRFPVINHFFLMRSVMIVTNVIFKFMYVFILNVSIFGRSAWLILIFSKWPMYDFTSCTQVKKRSIQSAKRTYANATV